MVSDEDLEKRIANDGVFPITISSALSGYLRSQGYTVTANDDKSVTYVSVSSITLSRGSNKIQLCPCLDWGIEDISLKEIDDRIIHSPQGGEKTRKDLVEEIAIKQGDLGEGTDYQLDPPRFNKSGLRKVLQAIENRQ
jgi:hypothetical protein